MLIVNVPRTERYLNKTNLLRNSKIFILIKPIYYKKSYDSYKTGGIIIIKYNNVNQGKNRIQIIFF